MRFEFRSQMQFFTGFNRRAAGFSAASCHSASVADAIEEFVRDRLARKRATTLKNDHATSWQEYQGIPS